MTCFWDGLLRGLNDDNLLLIGMNKRCTPHGFIESLQEHARLTDDIVHNGTEMSQQLLKENLEAVKVYDVKSIRSGYMCSTCDPFLCLVCSLCKCNIIHKYCGTKIEYTNVNNPINTLEFESNNSHFWFVQ